MGDTFDFHAQAHECLDLTVPFRAPNAHSATTSSAATVEADSHPDAGREAGGSCSPWNGGNAADAETGPAHGAGSEGPSLWRARQVFKIT